MTLREFLQKEVLILDGAMGTQVQDLFLPDEAFGGSEFGMLSDLLTVSRPEDLKQIHLNYFKAGAHAVETNTFGASALRLSEYDFKRLDPGAFATVGKDYNWKTATYHEISYFLSLQAAKVAVEAKKEALASLEKSERFVMGSIGPSNFVLTSTSANLRRGTFEQIVENFYHQCLGLIDGGVDALLFETMQDPLETKAALFGGKKALRERGVDVPIFAQVTVDAFSKMQIFNTDILAALTTLQGVGADVFGINCSIGPDLMTKTVEKLSKFSRLPLSVIPNAGLPVSEDGKTVFKLTPVALAEHLECFVKDHGVNVVGGCCGTRPDHIAAIASRLKGTQPKARQIDKTLYVSGPQNAVALNPEEGLIRIAERLNVRGSKKVREAVEGDEGMQMEALEDVVHEQVEDLGVPLIDVCMDSNLVDTTESLCKVIEHITTDFSGAMCLDSFSVEALVEAIKVYPGRPILNSISMEEYEDGVDKVDALVAPTHEHDPLYVALCTGPKGPGATAEEKYALAKEVFEKCTQKYGVKPEQLIFDVNAFPIGSESDEAMNFAVETLEGIAKVKSLHPDVKVSLGVGNLTTGLGKKPYMRKILTSVFMEEAQKKGLDGAIINPHHYVPVESLPPEDVKIARKVIFDHDMDAFADLEEIAATKKGGAAKKKVVYEDLPLEVGICQRIKDGYKDRKPGRVTVGEFHYDYQDRIVVDVAKALETHAPLDFINEHLMAAMKELGDGFGRGEVSLPHLLKSADVMKQAMGFIESFMKVTSGTDVHEEISYKATVVLGTVYQDVHSIGKDLVKTLLENYGYRVIDLGVQTPLDQFIEEAKKHNAQAIGMSALLVQTSNHMITVANMLKEADLEHVDILIGGAPVNWRHASYVSLHGQKDMAQMLPNVFYCPSGMDGVNMLNQLLESDEKRANIYQENAEKLKWHFEYAEKKQAETEELLKTLPRRKITVDELPVTEHFTPKVWKPKVSEIQGSLDLATLFSLNWRYGSKASWAKKGVSEEMLQEQLQDWIERCDKNAWLVPQAAYAVFPCRRAGDDVVVFHPRDKNSEIGRFAFNPVIGRSKEDVFSVAQYFSDEAGVFDAIGLQITTSGSQVEKKIAEFKEKGDSESAYLLQGLSDRVAEDLAEIVHGRLRSELGLSEKQGQRYSPGYPALKDIQMNTVLATCLSALDLLHMGITDGSEFTPTGTTGAVVSFHKEASYD